MEKKGRIKLASVRNSTLRTVAAQPVVSCRADEDPANARKLATDLTPTNHEVSENALLNPSKVLKVEGGAGSAEFIKQPATDQQAPPPPPPTENLPRDPKTLRSVCTQWGIDASGMRRMVTNCREIVSDCTDDEVAHFADTFARKKRAEGDKRPLSGILIAKTAELLEDGIDRYRAGESQAYQPAEYPELPPPCPKCRTLGGRILTETVGAGIYAGKTYGAVKECDCPLGRTLSAAYRRQKEETKKLAYRGFRDVAEMMPGDEDQ